jgi:hypothetical protein
MEGFEVDGANATAMARKYDAAAGTGSTDTGRLHGVAMSVDSSTRFRTRSLTSPTGTITIGFGFKDGAVSNPSEDFEIVILNGVSEQLNLVTVQVDTTHFRFDLYRGATLLDSSASYSVLNWHYFEFQAVIATGTGGSYEFRHNETLDFSGSSVNTASSGSANWDVVDFNNVGTGTSIRLDDIYILDGTGSANNDFLGDCVIEGRLPTADGTPTDWTPSSGSDHYALLDDTNDGTYVSTSTPTDIDYFTFDSLSFITGTIHGVQAMATMSLDVLGSRGARLKALSVAATDNGSTQTIASTNYSTVWEIFETDPNTAAAWSISAVDAASFGFELVS